MRMPFDFFAKVEYILGEKEQKMKDTTFSQIDALISNRAAVEELLSTGIRSDALAAQQRIRIMQNIMGQQESEEFSPEFRERWDNILSDLRRRAGKDVLGKMKSLLKVEYK